MKNLFVKTIVVFLAACISLTCSVACNGKPKDSGSGQGDQTDSGYYVVENGSSEYKILLSSDAGENVELAADELKLFIQKSTGVALDIITDNSAAFDASAKYLSLGKNRAFMNTGFSVDDSLGYQGFILKTKDRSVYMCGGGDPGTLYAAYEYLYRIMKFEVFSADECYYEKLDKIAFSDLDFSDKPDIEYRENSYACYNVNSETKANMRRMRWYANKRGGIGPGYIYGSHNAPLYFDDRQLDLVADKVGYTVSQLQSMRDDYFLMDTGIQLCYTAHGDADKLDIMVDVVLEVMKDALINNPDFNIICFQQEDRNMWCGCESCTQYIAAHGGFSASTQTFFVNKVAKKLKAWLNEEYPGREVDILVFAYHKTTNAPVRYDETSGKYVPFSDDMIMEDNITVEYAPITADYYYSFNDKINTAYRSNIDGWAAVCKHLYFWTYSTNFAYYPYFWDTFGSMQENYRLMVGANCISLFDQSQYTNYNSTGFHILKSYLNAKLAWNCNENYEELTDRWFDMYFRDASATMRELFEKIRVWYAYLIEKEGLTGVFGEDMGKQNFWPFNMLLEWEGIIDRAYEDILPVRETDAELYEKLHDRINLESLFIRYVLCTLYSGRYDSDVLLAKRKQFKEDAMHLNLTNIGEGESMNSIYSSWEI